MKRLLIVGAGGFGREVLAWLAQVQSKQQDWAVSGFLDADPDALEKFNIPERILGNPDTFNFTDEDRFICAIGDPRTRLRVGRALQERGAHFISLVHPNAMIGERCTMGVGCIVCPGCIVTCDVTLGDFVLLNIQSTVGHDSVIDDGCTLSPHCDVTGGVRLGSGVFVGSHASILPRAIIGEGSTIGAGSVVLKKVSAGITVMGVPARQIYGFTKFDGQVGEES